MRKTKTKCIRDFECEICHCKGMLQILTKSYARVRHYLRLNEFGKPVFEYHRNSIEYVNRNLGNIKTDLASTDHMTKNYDHNLKELNPNNENKTISPFACLNPAFKAIEWSKYEEYLNKIYVKQYAKQQFSNSVKYFDCLENPSKILTIPTSNRANVLKALICLSKFLGKYLEFKDLLQKYGVKWINADAFSSFIRIFNNSHSDLPEWYHKARNILNDNEKLYLRFML